MVFSCTGVGAALLNPLGYKDIWVAPMPAGKGTAGKQEECKKGKKKRAGTVSRVLHNKNSLLGLFVPSLFASGSVTFLPAPGRRAGTARSRPCGASRPGNRRASPRRPGAWSRGGERPALPGTGSR